MKGNLLEVGRINTGYPDLTYYLIMYSVQEDTIHIIGSSDSYKYENISIPLQDFLNMENLEIKTSQERPEENTPGILFKAIPITHILTIKDGQLFLTSYRTEGHPEGEFPQDGSGVSLGGYLEMCLNINAFILKLEEKKRQGEIDE